MSDVCPLPHPLTIARNLRTQVCSVWLEDGLSACKGLCGGGVASPTQEVGGTLC